MTTLTKIRLDGVEYDLGGGSFTQEQADWATTDTTDATYIKNKPNLTETASGGWALTTKTVDGASSTLIVRPNGTPQWISRFSGNEYTQAIVVSSMLSPYAKTADLGSLATKSSITHSEVSDWDTATASFLTEHQDISGLLAKTGGTMSGVITRNGVLAQSGSTSGSITIQNGTAASGGGGIWMYGASHTNKGKVRLQAYDSTHKKYCALDANGDGTLTWCGDSVATTNYVDAAIAAITDADSTGY